MNSKIWLINLALLGITILFGVKLYDTWSHAVHIPLKHTAIESTGRRDAGTPKVFSRRSLPAEEEYEGVVKNNLFVQERETTEKEESSTAEITPEALPTLPGQMRLFGVILTDGQKTALMTNPDRKAVSRKELWVKVGDAVGDYKVIEIENQKIVLEKERKSYDLFLYDKDKPRSPAVVVQGGGEEPKGVTAEQPVVKEIPVEKKEVPKTRQPESSPGGKTVVIETPFGKIVREEK
jgi:hypothetical protein